MFFFQLVFWAIYHAVILRILKQSIRDIFINYHKMIQ